jgi:hypothetical protein
MGQQIVKYFLDPVVPDRNTSGDNLLAQFKKTVYDEKKQGPAFQGIARLPFYPGKRKFPEKMDNFVMDAYFTDKRKREECVLSTEGLQRKIYRETVHGAFLVCFGVSPVPRGHTEQISRL